VPSTKVDHSRRPDGDAPTEALESLDRAAHVVKPRLRGWLHAGTAPLALVAGVVLVSLAPTSAGRIGGAVFLAASVLLFGTSGVYHRGTWSPRGEAILRRLDHANIYVFIAASYTPLALLLLTGQSRVLLLTVIWSAAPSGLRRMRRCPFWMSHRSVRPRAGQGLPHCWRFAPEPTSH